MSIFGTIASLLGRAGMPFLNKWLSKFDQPKLALSLKRGSGFVKQNLGFSSKNQFAANELVTQQHLVVSIYKLSWHYELTVTNNTSHVAYNILLTEPREESAHYEKKPRIEYTKPLLAHQSINHAFSYTFNFEGTNDEAEELLSKSPVPSFRIDYQNSKSGKFFTILKPDENIERQNEYGKANS